jgi:deoxyadenosine/deoxycytidine kinase
MENGTLIAEIVGPSGAGKSTLSAALNASGRSVKAGITVWGLPVASLLTSGLISLPDLASLSIQRRSAKSDELKQVIRLTAFRRLLKRYTGTENGRRYNTLFMDEGVLFALAKLRADIGQECAGTRLVQWEAKMLDRWSGILDAVIWLDAPDMVLIERIRTRAKLHRMKDEPDHRIKEFLTNYRTAYEFVVSEITQRSSIRVLRFTTEDLDSAAMAEEVIKFTGPPTTPDTISRVLTAARGIENEQTA